jgi:hypothetical protein
MYKLDLSRCVVCEGEGDTEVERILTLWGHQRSADGNMFMAIFLRNTLIRK